MRGSLTAEDFGVGLRRDDSLVSSMPAGGPQADGGPVFLQCLSIPSRLGNTFHLWLSDEGGAEFLPSQTLDNANCLSDLARADRYFRSSLGNR